MCCRLSMCSRYCAHTQLTFVCTCSPFIILTQSSSFHSLRECVVHNWAHPLKLARVRMYVCSAFSFLLSLSLYIYIYIYPSLYLYLYFHSSLRVYRHIWGSTVESGNIGVSRICTENISLSIHTYINSIPNFALLIDSV